VSWPDRMTRDRYVRAAQASPLLDAAFLILFYNRDVKRWESDPKPPEIDPMEVLPSIREPEFSEALRRARRMYEQASDVGKAFHALETSDRTYEQELEHFKEENPGFGDGCYALAIGAGIREMR
jgi:hypothetical protein